MDSPCDPNPQPFQSTSVVWVFPPQVPDTKEKRSHLCLHLFEFLTMESVSTIRRLLLHPLKVDVTYYVPTDIETFMREVLVILGKQHQHVGKCIVTKVIQVQASHILIFGWETWYTHYYVIMNWVLFMLGWENLYWQHLDVEFGTFGCGILCHGKIVLWWKTLIFWKKLYQYFTNAFYFLMRQKQFFFLRSRLHWKLLINKPHYADDTAQEMRNCPNCGKY